LKQLANMLNPLSVDIWSNHVSFGSIIYGLWPPKKKGNILIQNI
jgi:hypothetical protein